MLIVMEYRNVQLLHQTLLNLKTPGSTDIFEIDSAKYGTYRFDDENDFLRVLRIQT
ncbi:hypothetical protein D3C77_665440 [compost metagenome]